MLRLLMALGLGMVASTFSDHSKSLKIDTSLDESAVESPAEIKTLPVVLLENASEKEAHTLEVLQARGITHPHALAVILGNIKQESLFEHNICEGGARVNYEHCRSGGFGLIQWTTQGRYDGLGRHARNLGLSPTSFETQLSYVFREREWKQVEPHFMGRGDSIDSYMRSAHRWLGWGIHGNRTRYAFDYLSRMSTVDVSLDEHPTSKFTYDHHYLK